jgi:hypothetical protein
MMQLGAHYKMTLVYVNTDTILTVRHLVSINEINLRKLFILKSLQNMEHGQIIPKQVCQVEHLRWIHLLPQKDKLLKPANEMDKINHVKLRPGFVMAVSLLLKGKMVKNGEIFLE